MKRYYAGIDLGGTKILSVITDENRTVVSQDKTNTQPAEGANVVVENIVNSVKNAAKKGNISETCLMGIGIGVPGPVDPLSGMVYDCPNLTGWKNIHIKAILEKEFSIPVTVENDARVAGLAEARIGAAKKHSHVFYVTISTGIGGAIIINGEIYHGANGAAGEFGQMKLLDRTVLEQSFSGKAIEKIYGISTTSIPDLLKQNDTGAKKALRHIINGLSVYLSNIATLLNPEIIVVGGGVSLLGDILITPLQKNVREMAFSISGKNIKVVQAELGVYSGALGAVESIFKK